MCVCTHVDICTYIYIYVHTDGANCSLRHKQKCYAALNSNDNANANLIVSNPGQHQGGGSKGSLKKADVVEAGRLPGQSGNNRDTEEIKCNGCPHRYT